MKKLGICIAFLFVCLEAWASPILFDVVVQTVDLGGGLTRYEYSITAPADGNIYQFAVPVADGVVEVGSAISPTLWDVLEAPTEVSWLSQGPSSDLQALSTLNGFAFTARGNPIVATLYAQVADPNTGAFLDIASASGLVPGGQVAATVPEPSSAQILICGLIGLVGCTLLRRRRHGPAWSRELSQK